MTTTTETRELVHLREQLERAKAKGDRLAVATIETRIRRISER